MFVSFSVTRRPPCPPRPDTLFPAARLSRSQGGGLLERLPPIQRWLNRILALRIATQNAIFEEYIGLIQARGDAAREAGRSEEHTSELQSLMRIAYAVFCLTKKTSVLDNTRTNGLVRLADREDQHNHEK